MLTGGPFLHFFFPPENKGFLLVNNHFFFQIHFLNSTTNEHASCKILSSTMRYYWFPFLAGTVNVYSLIDVLEQHSKSTANNGGDVVTSKTFFSCVNQEFLDCVSCTSVIIQLLHQKEMAFHCGSVLSPIPLCSLAKTQELPMLLPPPKTGERRANLPTLVHKQTLSC